MIRVMPSSLTVSSSSVTCRMCISCERRGFESRIVCIDEDAVKGAVWNEAADEDTMLSLLSMGSMDRGEGECCVVAAVAAVAATVVVVAINMLAMSKTSGCAQCIPKPGSYALALSQVLKISSHTVRYRSTLALGVDNNHESRKERTLDTTFPTPLPRIDDEYQ